MSAKPNEYQVSMSRDTSEEMRVRVFAMSEDDAREQALDLASSDDAEWSQTDFVGKTQIDMISLIVDEETEQEEVIFNPHDTPVSNVEFVTELMEFSEYGPLAQLFVMDALAKFSKRVAEAAPEEFAGMGDFISAESWQGVAKEIHQKFTERNRV
jgi:hypothetical protein